MDRYILLGYIILYAILAVGTVALYAVVAPDEEKKGDKAWETPLDIGLLLTGLAGMLCLYLSFEPPWMKILWRPISVALVAVQLGGEIRARLSLRRAAGTNADERAATAILVATLLFLAPSFVLNLYYAFR